MCTCTTCKALRVSKHMAYVFLCGCVACACFLPNSTTFVTHASCSTQLQPCIEKPVHKQGVKSGSALTRLLRTRRCERRGNMCGVFTGTNRGASFYSQLGWGSVVGNIFTQLESLVFQYTWTSLHFMLHLYFYIKIFYFLMCYLCYIHSHYCY